MTEMQDTCRGPRQAVRDGPSSTTGETQTLAQARRGRAFRRAAVLAMVAFVVAGLFGVFGYRQGSRSVSTGDYAITLSYPAITSGGLPTNWTLEIDTVDQRVLPTIEIRTTRSYFDAFDHNALTPEPDATWQDDDLVWTYEPDGETTLVVELDLRTQPYAR